MPCYTCLVTEGRTGIQGTHLASRRYREVTAVLYRSQAIHKVMQLATKVAALDCPVLITGESGTGKELVARRIHEASPRRSAPFLPINAAAIPDELVESQLFGHVAGAFSGARQARLGAFRSACGGTLLLDEIGDVPLHVQPKLLRAMEASEVVPVGRDTPEPIDVRFLTATSRDLHAMVEQGHFRRDLLYRINAVEIHIPPLRERPEDILLLAEAFAEKYARQMQRACPVLAPEVREVLLEHPWYGNVRELAHVMEYALLVSDSDRIRLDDLPCELNGVDRAPAELDGLNEAVARFRCNYIRKVLALTRGNRQEAARRLRISEATLFRHIERCGLKGYALPHGHKDSQIRE
ncbi:MAG: hypothetical protein D6721_05940 [Gammaproteobacteria bacterium]|nr:MAG: hypothetical protein D6721_05940 [Gammaproteobacteria bacterium]